MYTCTTQTIKWAGQWVCWRDQIENKNWTESRGQKVTWKEQQNRTQNLPAMQDVCMMHMNRVRLSWTWGSTHELVLSNTFMNARFTMVKGHIKYMTSCTFMYVRYSIQEYNANLHRMSQFKKWTDEHDIYIPVWTASFLTPEVISFHHHHGISIHLTIMLHWSVGYLLPLSCHQNKMQQIDRPTATQHKYYCTPFTDLMFAQISPTVPTTISWVILGYSSSLFICPYW